jgi:hypothetical protein
MRKTHAFISAIALGIGIAAWLGVYYCRKGHEIRAISRIKIEVVDDSFYKNYKIVNGFVVPPFYESQFSAIKRFLNSPQCSVILAMISGTEPKNFAFEKVDRVRGTELIALEYSGVDSNIVMMVASNAANLVVSSYKTNFPTLKASYVEVFIRK